MVAFKVNSFPWWSDFKDYDEGQDHAVFLSESCRWLRGNRNRSDQHLLSFRQAMAGRFAPLAAQ